MSALTKPVIIMIPKVRLSVEEEAEWEAYMQKYARIGHEIAQDLGLIPPEDEIARHHDKDRRKGLLCTDGRTLYLIEGLRVDPVEKELSAALTYVPSCISETREFAEEIVARAGVDERDGWPVFGKPIARRRMIELPIVVPFRDVRVKGVNP